MPRVWLGVGSTGGDTPAYELLLLGWLACAAVGSVLGVALRGVMRRNVAWRIGRAMCVAFLALFVAMAAVLLVVLLHLEVDHPVTDI